MVEINIMYAFHYDHHVEFIANLVFRSLLLDRTMPQSLLAAMAFALVDFLLTWECFSNLMYTRN